VIECHFCNATVASVEAAIKADWIPSFYFPGDDCESCNPVCPKCCDENLEQDESGELVCVTEKLR